jgi:hypothetical protein
MISYDDLVAALQAWRARQGLPVAEPAAGSGPRTAPPAAPTPAPRTNPPAPPPMAAHRASPMPLAPPEENSAIDEAELGEHEIEEHAMIEESHYENEGDDFAMSFAKDGHNGHVTGVDGPDGTETMVGHDPQLEPDRPSDLTDPAAAQRNGRDDW